MNRTEWQQIKNLLEEARKVAPTRRRSFLMSACAHCPDLQEKVITLLEATPDDCFMHSPWEGVFSSLLSADSESSLVGQQIGGFRLESRLSSGGMGTVYLAERVNGSFQQRVAIKVIKHGMDSDLIQRRFRVEQKALARLDHPNIARLIDGGVTAEGLQYFVMEFVDGRPIDIYCGDRGLRVTDRLKLFCEVCAAVKFAHRNLVVHRDLKPNNILVTPDGQPKLLDFGIAKLLTAETDSRTTGVGGPTPMTVEYASPEQIRNETVSTATDIYSLGVILYELLTGRPPHRCDPSAPGRLGEIICNEEPRKPSSLVARTRKLNGNGRWDELGAGAGITPGLTGRGGPSSRQLRGDLDIILLKALQKNPCDRYESVEQFSNDVQRHVDGMPILARPPSKRYQLWKLACRNKVASMFAVTLVVVLVAFGALSTVQATREHAARIIAIREADRAKHAARRAEQIRRFLEELLIAADPRRTAHEMTVRDLLDEAQRRIDTDWTDDPALEADLRSILGRTYERFGISAKAVPQFRRVLRIRETHLGPNHLAVADACVELAALTYCANASDEGLQLYERALRIRRGALGMKHPDVVTTMTALGHHLKHMDRLFDAEDLLREVLVIRRRAPENHLALAEAIEDLGGVLKARADFPGAEALYREGLSIRRRAYGDTHKQVAHGLQNLGHLYQEMGAYDEADAQFRAALEMFRELGDERPNELFMMALLAGVMEDQGDYEQALALFRRTLEHAERAFPAWHFITLWCHLEYGDCLLKAKRFADAERHFQISLAGYLSIAGEQSRNVGNVRKALARLHDAREAARPASSSPRHVSSDPQGPSDAPP